MNNFASSFIEGKYDKRILLLLKISHFSLVVTIVSLVATLVCIMVLISVGKIALESDVLYYTYYCCVFVSFFLLLYAVIPITVLLLILWYVRRKYNVQKFNLHLYFKRLFVIAAIVVLIAVLLPLYIYRISA